jgi:hypothetical protein
MTTTDEILAMKTRFAAGNGGREANVLYVTDAKWHEWWYELSRIGNPHVDDKLAVAIGRKGFAAMRGQVWQGMRVERLNPSNQARYRTFVDREAQDAASGAADAPDAAAAAGSPARAPSGPGGRP